MNGGALVSTWRDARLFAAAAGVAFFFLAPWAGPGGAGHHCRGDGGLCPCISAWAGKDQVSPRVRIPGNPVHCRSHGSWSSSSPLIHSLQDLPTNVIRFPTCAPTASEVTGKRVFIRADLNVPQDDASYHRRHPHPHASIPAIEMALKAGAAVMVTSHLGPPTGGRVQPELSGPVAKRP